MSALITATPKPLLDLETKPIGEVEIQQLADGQMFTCSVYEHELLKQVGTGTLPLYLRPGSTSTDVNTLVRVAEDYKNGVISYAVMQDRMANALGPVGR